MCTSRGLLNPSERRQHSLTLLGCAALSLLIANGVYDSTLTPYTASSLLVSGAALAFHEYIQHRRWQEYRGRLLQNHST